MEKSMQKEKNALEFSERDYDRLTGMMKKKAFEVTAKRFLREHTEGTCCILAADIANFHFLNKWYGREQGDRLLTSIADYLKDLAATGRAVCAYMGRDNFAILLLHDEQALSAIGASFERILREFDRQEYFKILLGGMLIENPDAPVMELYDCAVSALEQGVRSYDSGIVWYDSRVDREKEEELLLFPEIMHGLENGEFIFYLQPKCLLENGKIMGAEALVRWNRPNAGVVAPGNFIPLLERNGYITRLDRYIWEEVCKCIRGWMDSGITPLPISVNVSRIDIFVLDVAECFRELTEKYRIPPRYIEIEITESAYIEKVSVIRRTEEKLFKYGFKVLIDDFGSGYSSLNMLKDIRADMLKLDMKFIDLNQENLGKGIEIIHSVLDMAQQIRLRVVAEGMETVEQVECLAKLGCKYGQGYYFYRPMPVRDFEHLINDKNKVVCAV